MITPVLIISSESSAYCSEFIVKRYCFQFSFLTAALLSLIYNFFNYIMTSLIKTLLMKMCVTHPKLFKCIMSKIRRPHHMLLLNYVKFEIYCDFNWVSHFSILARPSAKFLCFFNIFCHQVKFDVSINFVSQCMFSK